MWALQMKEEREEQGLVEAQSKRGLGLGFGYRSTNRSRSPQRGSGDGDGDVDEDDGEDNDVSMSGSGGYGDGDDDCDHIASSIVAPGMRPRERRRRPRRTSANVPRAMTSPPWGTYYHIRLSDLELRPEVQ